MSLPMRRAYRRRGLVSQERVRDANADPIAEMKLFFRSERVAQRDNWQRGGRRFYHRNGKSPAG